MQCRHLVDVLKKELDELVEREGQLQRINDALMEAMSQQHPDDLRWKDKYHEQVEINQKLEKQVRELTRTKRSPLSPLSSARRNSLDVAWGDKTDGRSDSVKKMNRFMEGVVTGKQRDSLNRTAKKGGGREIVLRIVDERLNMGMR